MKYQFVPVLLVLFFSCTQKEINLSDFANYIKNERNGLVKIIQQQDLRFTAYYLPPIYWQQIQEHKGKKQFTSLETDAPQEWFLRLDIAAQKGQTLEKVFSQLQANKNWAATKEEMLLRIAQQFKLVVEGTTIPCKLAQTNFLFGKRSTIALVFEKPKEQALFSKDVTLIFSDKYFTQEQVQFVFAAVDLNNIPSLK